MTKLLESIKKMTDSAKGWDGRVDGFTKTIIEICEHYAKHLNLDSVDVFSALEKKRSYSYPNYYQWANFPKLDSVRIFENETELKEAIKPKQGFRCPHCNGKSKSPYVCDTEIEKGGKPCDWKSYGLFHTFGKGLRFMIKNKWLENAVVDEIFFPIALEK